MPIRIEQIAAEIEVLTETWRSRFRELSPDKAHAKPTPERWSIAEVVGHLVDSACNNHQRFARARFCTDLVFPKYDQNQWVAAANYQACDWNSLVELWYHYNHLLANLIRGIPESQLSTPCTITPHEPCTLGFLVTDYVDHMQHHLRILSDRIVTGSSAT